MPGGTGKTGVNPLSLVLNVLDRKMNVVQAQANVAKSLGNKGAEQSGPVKTPQQLLEKVGTATGTLNNAISVADTFESGGRVLSQMSKGHVPSAMPATLVGKTLGKLVPGLNIASAVSSASNTQSVFSNPSSTKGQKAHAVFDTTTAFGAALPVPLLSQASGVLNIVGSFFKP